MPGPACISLHWSVHSQTRPRAWSNHPVLFGGFFFKTGMASPSAHRLQPACLTERRVSELAGWLQRTWAILLKSAKGFHKVEAAEFAQQFLFISSMRKGRPGEVR